MMRYYTITTPNHGLRCLFHRHNRYIILFGLVLLYMEYDVAGQYDAIRYESPSSMCLGLHCSVATNSLSTALA